ncbi:MAG: Pyruvate carboxylase subunit B [Methanonatronarchaeales archaeon]|nr:Pyruvate carboxylase subunit B [Methanonatronarchaeales archaeon]
MVKIVDLMFRDAHQSLMATRMRTGDMLPIAETVNDAGYYALEVWGGATFDSCIRYLDEDPWERLRALSDAMPDVKMLMLLRGQNLVGYRNYPDDVVELFVEKAYENGVDIFRVFDALNDVRNMEKAIEVAKGAGAHVQGCISYTLSPIHTIEKYMGFAEELKALDCDSICVKDMAGLLSPGDARELVTSIRGDTGLPVDLHCHTTSGMAQMAYQAGVEAGADMIDTGISPLSGGTAHPPTESFVAAYEGTRHETGLSLERLKEVRDYFRDVREKYEPLIDPLSERVDTDVLLYQVPGGMMSNLMSQLKEQNAMDRYGDVLAEIPRVRKDLGYPPLVTPASQIVGTQAVMNVLTGERYGNVPQEVRDYVLGRYGRPPGEIDPEVKAKVAGGEEPIDHRPADDIEPGLPAVREEAGGLAETEEDLLIYALYPQVGLRFLRGESEAEEIPESVPEVEATSPSTGQASYTVEVDGEAFDVVVVPEGAAEATAAPSRDGLKASMQGTIVDVKVSAGDDVSEGEVVAVLEAMKMQSDVCADRDGTVDEVYVDAGQDVDAGQHLMKIA